MNINNFMYIYTKQKQNKNIITPTQIYNGCLWLDLCANWGVYTVLLPPPPDPPRPRVDFDGKQARLPTWNLLFIVSLQKKQIEQNIYIATGTGFWLVGFGFQN
jgi:hypothetical protein